MAKIRRNVWQLPAGDQTLFWYGRAVEEMQKKAITDPTSWRFQAAIHDYVSGRDPLAKQGEALPLPNIRTNFWMQCQHGSWFFLPWHRMYLHFFEQIVTAEIVKLGGPSDWALPYWNYSADLSSRLLPVAFRNPILPDGSKNYLFVAERDPECNAGQQFTDDGDVALDNALKQAQFSDSVQGNFGGLPSNFSHTGGGLGALERVPHGSMHGAIGGRTGWMGSFNTAGLDPIFWLHHANIDRLWEVWLNMDPQNHSNPSSLQWLANVAFSFFDANVQKVQLRCSEVVNTSALDYSYDDVSNPLGGPVAMGTPSLAASTMEETMPSANPPELRGATESSSQIHNAPAKIRVPTPLQAAAQMSSAAAVAAAGAPAVAKRRVLLQLENVTARGRAQSYDVYVNIPDDETHMQHPELLIGRIDLFGVVEASRASKHHPGSGLTYTLDISEIYHALSATANWDPEKLDVHLIPVRKWEGAKVTVGRVSIFFA